MHHVRKNLGHRFNVYLLIQFLSKDFGSFEVDDAAET